MNEELIQYLDGKFRKVDAEFSAIKEDLREARKERQILDRRINDTYNAVDGFIRVLELPTN